MTSRPRIPTLLASLLLTACNGLGLLHGPAEADATLNPTAGNEVSGHVRFNEVDGGVLVDARVSGLAPGGHGFHVHEKGDCSARDGSSAGEHFNPTGKAHGHPDAPQHHLGDLLMLVANAKGEARLRTIVKGLSITGNGRSNIVGRAVIVHAAPDDFITQPTGKSGAGVACGVIGAAKYGV